MSSSDEEWMKPPTLRRYGGERNEDPMLAARRQALQNQRGAAQPHVTSSNVTNTHSSLENVPPEKSLQAQRNLHHAGGSTEEELESLRVELEAKKKELASLREKETTLRDHWRAQKAQRISQNAELENKLRRQRDTIEDAKAAAERELRDLMDEQQRQLREECELIDKEIAEEYESQIEAQRVLLAGLQNEESKLQGELNAEGTANDIVNKCISSAVSAILQEVQTMFDENASNSEEWACEVEKLVRDEVRSSFSVACDTEAQREREEHEKIFNELLAFWRKVEEEERDYTLKIDEQMFLDFQSMVNEDMDRMQQEELTMEDIYIKAREAWASHYQEMLNKEIQATLVRQTDELEEMRVLRHQLHLERMKILEEQHQDMMEKQKWFHENEIKLLREQYAKEEELEEERDRVNVEAQINATRAIEESKRILTTLEELFDELKDYRVAVDKDRAALEIDRQRALDAHVETLTSIKDMVSRQTVSISEEQNSLSAALSKLEVLSRTVEQHLEDERVWLGKQEAKFSQGKAEWDRECRRWQRMVEDQKCEVEERFNRVLNELNEAASLIIEEGREAAADRDSVAAAFRIASEQAAGEVEQLRQREEELNKRQEEMTRLLSEFDVKETHTDRQWRQLQEEREELEAETAALREDDIKLRESNQHSTLKSQRHLLNTHLTGVRGDAHAIRHQLETLRVQLQKNREGAYYRAVPTNIAPSKHQRAGQPAPTASNNTNRLPLRVLHELKEMLGKGRTKSPRFVSGARPVSDSLAGTDVISSPHTYERSFRHDSADQIQKRHRDRATRREKGFVPSNGGDPTRDTSTNYQDSSSNNFTHLLAVTDTESLDQSLRT